MPRRVQKEAERTRRRILASALSFFVKKGYEHTTFTDIASRLGMTKGAVYWHFKSKTALLMALVDEMREKFSRQAEELMPKDGLTFPAVAEMMVANAERILDDAKGKAYFMLMLTQIRWGDDSMSRVREYLLSRSKNGPYHTFIRAIENDKAAGRVREDVNSVAVASACVSVWDGLVRGQIDRLLECDLAAALRNSYAAFWKSIST